MSEVKVVEEIAAPAAKVWELVRDFGGLARWAAGIGECTLEGQGVGAVRTLGMPGGISLRERLESYDEGGRTFSYSIVEPNPLPMTSYLSVVRIAESGPDRCTYHWSGSFEPAGQSEEQVKGLVEGIYRGGIRSLTKTLGV